MIDLLLKDNLFESLQIGFQLLEFWYPINMGYIDSIVSAAQL